MPEQPDFLERVKRELSAEELAGLKTYSAQTERGRLLFLPIIRKMGGEVQWVSRVQVKGAVGPLPATRATLQAIVAPPDWPDKARNFLDALQLEYPALPQPVPERPALGMADSER